MDSPRAAPAIRGPDPPEQGARGSPTGPLLLRLLIKLAAIAAILALANAFVLGMQAQHGNRMHPYVMDGDVVITFKRDTYRVGDVVVYRSPRTGKPDISRIAAIGAYEIQLTDQGQLLINGSPVDEKVFYPTQPLPDSQISFPYYMTPEGYFLLDDYRIEGLDSRLFGQVTREDLLGKVVYVFRRRGI